jgi:hypothetical protein
LILWFSQKEPDFRNLTNEPVKYKPKLELVKRELRLFEANKYKPTIVGTETNRKINDALKQREDDLKVETMSPPKNPTHVNLIGTFIG